MKDFYTNLIILYLGYLQNFNTNTARTQCSHGMQVCF